MCYVELSYVVAAGCGICGVCAKVEEFDLLGVMIGVCVVFEFD